MSKPCDSIVRDSVWIAMESSEGVPRDIINLTKICIDNAKANVRISKHTTEIFSITNGLEEGDGSSPLLSNIVLDMASKELI